MGQLPPDTCIKEGEHAANAISAPFPEGKIGKLTTRNRLVMPPMGTNLAREDGEVTDTQIRYYEERAQGGAGMIIVEIGGVDPGGRAIPRQIGLWDDKFIPGLSKLASAIKNAGAVAAIQIHHAGRQTAIRLQDPACSAVTSRVPLTRKLPGNLLLTKSKVW